MLGARPLFFAVSAYIQSVILTPGIRTLVATRVHRWTLGHSKTFFENDFAGRVAQKEVQAANALTDVVVESIHTVLFALTSVIAAVVIISIIDWRIGSVVLLWFVGFVFVMRFFMPRIKAKAAITFFCASRCNGSNCRHYKQYQCGQNICELKTRGLSCLGSFWKAS